MKKFFLIFLILLTYNLIALDVKTIDFLKSKNLNYNAAGPLLVKYDKLNNRIVLLNTNSSYLTLINAESFKVRNIYVKKRVPQFLKHEIIKISSKGEIYFIADKSVVYVNPENNKAITINTIKQYESLDIDENNMTAYLTSRESKYIAKAVFKKHQLKLIRWLKREMKFENLNQTPPPPERKVIVNSILNRMYAIDTKNNRLYEFSIKGKFPKLIKKINLRVKKGKRWHLAGINRENHKFYIVIETAKREVIQAFEFDMKKDKINTINLEIFREAAGIRYNPILNQVYIPYDNNGIVIIVDFNKNEFYKVEIPGFGNDAIAFDNSKKLLFVSSWEYGEIEVIDLEKKKFLYKIENLGILPHMFSLAYNENNSTFFIPKGATAVNGNFGAAILTYNLKTGDKKKIYTGWAPVSIVKRGNKESFLVFNSEDEFSEVNLNGDFKTYKLPFDYPHDAIQNLNKNIYLSYGPHQSYWPVVYIWPAKNGILTIFSKDLKIHDRRIPRLANRIVIDNNNKLYCLQNSWGKEKFFLAVLKNELRYYEPNKNIKLSIDIERETTPIDLKYDKQKNWLYIIKSGEKENQNGNFIIFDLNSNKEIFSSQTGISPTSISFNNKNIFITNFDSDTITIINKEDFTKQEIHTDKSPLKSTIYKNKVYVINHLGKTVFSLNKTFRIPYRAFPDNIKTINNKIYITLHNSNTFYLISFIPEQEKFKTIIKYKYPFGQTEFNTKNTAFFMSGQFGDAIFEINKIIGYKNHILVTDYLSGKLFIIQE